tara:strand:+ start:1468 stop:1722 length:255 start_codon:yes stop_codon:yes gene_type:complete
LKPYNETKVEPRGFIGLFLLLKINKMDLLIKAEHEHETIELIRLSNGSLFISIEDGGGRNLCILEPNEVQALKDYLKITDERLD